jgi:hypothetical protein
MSTWRFSLANRAFVSLWIAVGALLLLSVGRVYSDPPCPYPPTAGTGCQSCTVACTGCSFVRQDWECNENGDAGCCDWLKVTYDCPDPESDCIIYVGATNYGGAQFHCQPKAGGGQWCVEEL